MTASLFSDYRIAFEWEDLRKASVRTLGTKVWARHAAVPKPLQALVTELMRPKHKGFFPIDNTAELQAHLHPDVQGLPTSYDLQDLLTDACPELVSLAGGENTQPMIVASREVGFHVDGQYAELDAYVAWILGTTEPMDFVHAGNSFAAEAGSIFLFDAKMPHALLRRGAKVFTPYRKGDYSHKAVFLHGVLALTEPVREQLGIQVLHDKDALARAWKPDLQVSSITGEAT